MTVLGDEGVPPELQSGHVEALAEPDAYSVLRKLVAGVATIHARMAPMIGVLSAVSQDPAGVICQQSEDLRRADMTRLADTLARKMPLRRGMTRRRAAQLLFVLTGPARPCTGTSSWRPGGHRGTGRAGSPAS
jgi:hypothetical protein